jgi:hypothetical protein
MNNYQIIVIAVLTFLSKRISSKEKVLPFIIENTKNNA